MSNLDRRYFLLHSYGTREYIGAHIDLKSISEVISHTAYSNWIFKDENNGINVLRYDVVNGCQKT